ncbi:MAG TPA: KpsF/GutQ family sugar-phosphate isomerase [Phycisphaerae bacterium]|nr:KpsF/GutQ family sugar-phosphate isomerase [Phycisphaerae bacterium]
MAGSKTTTSWLALARRVIGDEADGLQALRDALDERFDRVVEAILNLRGQLIVTGLGKSGLVARKIAATLTSTGTPAVTMHPVEGLHGDLGIVSHDDGLLVLSKSGNTEELARFVEHFRRRGGGVVIAVTEKAASKLAELAGVVVVIPTVPEACPLNLAPTTSTTMMLALGDALAMALLEARGFGAEHFAELHPAGSLGKRLLLRVKDLMHAEGDLPVVSEQASFRELLQQIDAKRLGMACVVDGAGRFVGTFTDGDLRRLTLRGIDPGKLDLPELLRKSRRDPGDLPVVRSTVGPETLVVECLDLMEKSKITQLVVLDDRHRPVGVIRQHDIVAAGMA